MIEIKIDINKIKDYQTFLKCKQLPKYHIKDNIVFTDKISYNLIFGHKYKIDKLKVKKKKLLFDYQEFIINKALDCKNYAVYADCGLGKTRIELEWGKIISDKFGKVLYLAPLSVLDDIQKECETMYGYRLSNLRYDKWKTPIALLNYESMKDIDMTNVSAIILDEASILKSGTGAICKWLYGLASRCKFRLCASATPSPNDHGEYASQALFLGYVNSLKEFYAKFFRKDGVRWLLKSHAVDNFYKYLANMACYIKSPSKLGFEQGAEIKEEPEYRLMRSYSGIHINQKLFADSIGMRESSQIFGKFRADTKSKRFKDSIKSIDNKKNLIWVSRNIEEDAFKRNIKNAVVISGATPIEKRVDLINAYRKNEIQNIISKPKILGFGINLPETEQVLYSGYTFSFESFYQAVRRAHRYGRKKRLIVNIPVADIEEPIWEILQSKLRTFEKDIMELQDRFNK